MDPSPSTLPGEVVFAEAKAPKILNREELVKAIVDHKKNAQEMRQ